MTLTSHAFWQRYVDVGERMAIHEPDFFPTVVCLLETLADGDLLSALVEDALDCPVPRQTRPMSAQSLGDLLCIADESLADIPTLDTRLSKLSPSERRVAEQWARAKVAARDTTATSTTPDCVARLYTQRSQ